jgi:hypothetical protein
MCKGMNVPALGVRPPSSELPETSVSRPCFWKRVWCHPIHFCSGLEDPSHQEGTGYILYLPTSTQATNWTWYLEKGLPTLLSCHLLGIQEEPATCPSSASTGFVPRNNTALPFT